LPKKNHQSTTSPTNAPGLFFQQNFSNRIRLKINDDITGNQKDNHVIMFMVKALQILQKVASLQNEKFVTLRLDNYLHVKFNFNPLENYPYITSSICEVLGTMNSLPFKKKDFKSFIEYYEKYLNSCSIADGISFLYLLRDNNIPYAKVFGIIIIIQGLLQNIL
jgi:hypothetical protein